MADSTACSREKVGLSNGSSIKEPDDEGGTKVVGEGSTSVKRDGGPFCASLLQIALPHGTEVLEEWTRPVTEPVEEPAAAAQGVLSLDGVVGCEALGENVPPPPSEAFRCGA